MVLRETAALIAIGLAAGVPASLACARLIQSKLFGLKPADPLTLCAALCIMIVVAIASGYLAGAACIAGGSADRVAV
jgi:hypothetical protein